MAAAVQLEDWIGRLFQTPEMLQMGHHQRAEDLNLGLGWLYYSLARIIRPQLAVVIGSWRGFTPLLFGKALQDNGEGGRVLFIDPSLVDGFWSDPEEVARHFASHGVTNVEHRKLTTQQFAETAEYRAMGEAGLVFVDGYHTAEQCAFDFGVFEKHLAPDGIVLLHDSARVRTSRMYGAPYEHTVVHFVAALAQRADLQVFDLPFADGVTLVRRRAAKAL